MTMFSLNNKLIYAKGSTPLDIPNLTAWYGDYVNGGTLRTTLGNGANVNQWDDLSGRVAHAGEKVSQPTYNSTKNSIYFNPASAIGSTTKSVFDSTSMVSTIFLAWECVADGNLADSYQLWAGGASASPATYWGLSNRGDANTVNLQGGSSQQIWAGAQFDANNKGIFTFNSSANYQSSTTFRRNGVLKTSDSGGGTTACTIASKFVIGGYFNGTTMTAYNTAAKEFHAYEYIIYSRSLTANEVLQVEGYLNMKYSLY